MKAVIVYESMYGNTRTIAYAIGEGLRPTADVTVASASPGEVGNYSTRPTWSSWAARRTCTA